MISKIENDITLCKMGDGTLFSGVVIDDEGNPRGIAFSKTPEDKNGSIIFQIENIQGFTGYMLPIIALMEEWHKSDLTAGTDEEQKMFMEAIKDLKETLEPFKPKAK
ncbi:hypothetical protein [Planococcus sp. SSTMD024]|uniref:hypothetical protein n=1 Tax=Planococcus sp. SSTMD024 TaxID=3242163 RepID=UPI00351EB188